MTGRVSRRAYWHRKITGARRPATRLQAACDYLRAVAAGAPPEAVMREVLPVAEAAREAADRLDAAYPREDRR